jgi:probable HAF family extracellular repeat protein
MRHVRILTVILVVSLLAIAGHLPAYASGISLVTLPQDPACATGSGEGTLPQGINDRGDIVGLCILDSNFDVRGFLLRGGSYTNFNIPAGVSTTAWGINNEGDIVGYYNDSSGMSHGFLRHQGQYTTIDDPLGVGGTQAIRINDRGDIVGGYADGNNVSHGFLLRKGTYTTLDDPQAGTGLYQGTFAYGINNLGDVVGIYTDSSNVTHGFLLHDGRYTTIDDPLGQYSQPMDINARGQIVGFYLHFAPGSFQGHGFLWQNGTFTQIDGPAGPNGVGTFTYGINNQGQIVGVYANSINQNFPFLATIR